LLTLSYLYFFKVRALLIYFTE